MTEYLTRAHSIPVPVSPNSPFFEKLCKLQLTRDGPSSPDGLLGCTMPSSRAETG